MENEVTYMSYNSLPSRNKEKRQGSNKQITKQKKHKLFVASMK